jgi:Cu-processing system ATP-binding protein
MNTPTMLLETRDVTKRFGRTPVLHSVSISLLPGRVTAVLGPNGSGKTTLNKTLLGLVRPNAGDVLLNGAVVTGTDAYRAHIGYMPQAPRFPEHLSARDVLQLVLSLRPDAPHVSLDDLVAGFDLASFYTRSLGVCSGGQRQRVNAAVALLFEPAVLILDEPTAGLDPVSSAALKDRIIAERNKGRAILMTSHVLSELEELADDVVFLLDGKIRFQGTLEMLRASTGGSTLERSIGTLMVQC